MIRIARAIVLLCIIGALAATCAAQEKPDLSDHTLYMVGQSHIDVAWRWQWSETIGVCRDTFGQAIKLMADYPDFGYSQSQALLYATMEQHYPELFAAIREQVAAGRWNVVGGMWVEPDLNLPSGEALVRQCLYGQRYFRNKLGVEARVGWAPDNFGIPWTIPQILRKSHMDSVAFAKFEFGPGPLLVWEGPDGSQVFFYNARSVFGRLEAALGGQGDLSRLPEAFAAVARESGSKAIVVPYGVGDHGGGPTRRDIELYHALARLPGMPKVKLATADEAVTAAREQAVNPPVWRDEIEYYHRGCYSSQAEMKRHNRYCEALLPNAEKFAVMAQMTGGFDYPREKMTDAWRGTLFNQFHDILPGSAIGPVYADATDLYRDVEAGAESVLDGALAVLAERAATEGEGQAVVVFNPLPWPRTDVVEATLDYDKVPENLIARDADGNSWAAQVAGHQRIYESFERCQVIFAARDVPPLGFKVFWIRQAEQAPTSGLGAGDYWIESPRFRVEVDPKTGHVVSVRDKQSGREVLAAGGHANVLRLLGDDSGGHTAWEIKYTGEQTDLAEPTYVRVAERGPVRATIQVEYLRNGSVYNQRISLYDDVERIDFPTTIDWRERHHLLKVSLPVAVVADRFTREIPFGNITHPCGGDEVPAQQWIDLSDDTWGVSLLNDCKYGHSVSGSDMTITLLRSPTDPDPVADVGRHTMTYSLYPHAGSWRAALTQRRAQELNTPLLARVTPKHGGPLGSSHSVAAVTPGNVFLAAIKPCEDSGAVVLRVWEAHGQAAQAEIRLPRAPRAAVEVDLLEQEVGPARTSGDTLVVDIKPYEIRSFKLSW
jgi:alpha-mannosidase